MKIPSIKLNPKNILPVLKIIQENEGNIDSIKRNIHAHLLHVSKRGKISERNAVYALAFPTLRRLNLLTGKGEHVRLGVDGKTLLKTYEMKRTDKFRRAMAKVILRADRESANVLETIKDLSKKQVSKEEIAAKLMEKGVETSATDDRLIRWLGVLRFGQFTQYLGVRVHTH